MEQQSSGVVGSGGQKQVYRLRWIIAAVAAVLVLSVITVYNVLNKTSKYDSGAITRTNVCKDDTNKQAASYINGNTNAVEYFQLVEKIKTTDGYDSDPNCLYTLLRFNLAKNLSGENDRYMSRLEKVYDSSRGFSPEFGETLSLQGLRERVVSMKSLNESYDSEMEKMNEVDEDSAADGDRLDVPQ